MLTDLWIDSRWVSSLQMNGHPTRSSGESSGRGPAPSRVPPSLPATGLGTPLHKTAVAVFSRIVLTSTSANQTMLELEIQVLDGRRQGSSEQVWTAGQEHDEGPDRPWMPEHEVHRRAHVAGTPAREGHSARGDDGGRCRRPWPRRPDGPPRGPTRRRRRPDRRGDSARVGEERLHDPIEAFSIL